MSETDSRHPKCFMPECIGTMEDELRTVRDDGKTIYMCESCLDDGWRMHVEVLD
jgi:hypothetical protein